MAALRISSPRSEKYRSELRSRTVQFDNLEASHSRLQAKFKDLQQSAKELKGDKVAANDRIQQLELKISRHEKDLERKEKESMRLANIIEQNQKNSESLTSENQRSPLCLCSQVLHILLPWNAVDGWIATSLRWGR